VSASDTAFSVFEHHPLLAGGANPSIQPALVSWYGARLDPRDPGRLRTNTAAFFPRGARHRLVADAYPNPPLGGAAAAALVGYHLLRTPYYGVDTDDWLRVALRRPARLCVALGHRVAAGLTVDGYWRAGRATVADDEQTVVDGMRQATKAGVFCKDVPAGVVSLPRARRLVGDGRDLAMDVLLAEVGGGAPAAPAVPPGRGAVTPNARCPDWLHEAWRTGTPGGGEDPETAGMTWRTWHPQVVRWGCAAGGGVRHMREVGGGIAEALAGVVSRGGGYGALSLARGRHPESPSVLMPTVGKTHPRGPRCRMCWRLWTVCSLPLAATGSHLLVVRFGHAFRVRCPRCLLRRSCPPLRLC